MILKKRKVILFDYLSVFYKKLKFVLNYNLRKLDLSKQ